jgi:hypothetical protein
MKTLHILCLAFLLGSTAYIYASPYEANDHKQKSAKKVDKEREAHKSCDKKARLAPTSYSAKTIKRACLKKYGLKKKSRG